MTEIPHTKESDRPLTEIDLDELVKEIIATRKVLNTLQEIYQRETGKRYLDM